MCICFCFKWLCLYNLSGISGSSTESSSSIPVGWSPYWFTSATEVCWLPKRKVTNSYLDKAFLWWAMWCIIHIHIIICYIGAETSHLQWDRSYFFAWLHQSFWDTQHSHTDNRARSQGLETDFILKHKRINSMSVQPCICLWSILWPLCLSWQCARWC